MEAEIRKADKVLRKRAQIIVVLGLIVLLAGYIVFDRTIQHWLQAESDMQRVIERTILFIRLLSYSVSAISFVFGFYFLRTAILIFRSQEFPYPKAKVLFDTKIVRGKEAKLKGAIALFISLLILSIAIFFPIYIHSILQTLIHLPVQ